jgi:NADPH:quinone reductase
MPESVTYAPGMNYCQNSLQALAPLGQIVIYGALNIQSFQVGVSELLGLIFKNQSLTGFAFVPLLGPATLRVALADLFDLRVKGELAVTISGRYPLDRAADAHRALEGRSTTGKLVLTA